MSDLIYLSGSVSPVRISGCDRLPNWIDPIKVALISVWEQQQWSYCNGRSQRSLNLTRRYLMSLSHMVALFPSWEVEHPAFGLLWCFLITVPMLTSKIFQSHCPNTKMPWNHLSYHTDDCLWLNSMLKCTQYIFLWKSKWCKAKKQLPFIYIEFFFERSQMKK